MMDGRGFGGGAPMSGVASAAAAMQWPMLGEKQRAPDSCATSVMLDVAAIASFSPPVDGALGVGPGGMCGAVRGCVLLLRYLARAWRGARTLKH